jgi:hypothetical protein
VPFKGFKVLNVVYCGIKVVFLGLFFVLNVNLMLLFWVSLLGRCLFLVVRVLRVLQYILEFNREFDGAYYMIKAVRVSFFAVISGQVVLIMCLLA